MKRKHLIIYFFTCITFATFHTSCSQVESDSWDTETKPSISQDTIAEYTMGDLEIVAKVLDEQGYDTSEIMSRIKEDSSQTKLIAAAVINSEKVITTIVNPANPSKMLKVSGVLLYPKNHYFKSNLKLVVATPGTYTDNQLAPSNFFSNLWTWQNNLISNSGGIAITPYLLNAAENPILLIDYPGFGASYGQIAHPYLDQKVLATSSISLIRKAQNILENRRVRLCTKEIMVTGYSQGAFSATSIVREIETNPANKDLKVSSLLVGGIPAYLSKILDLAIEKNTVDVSYFFPYALTGYKKVRYPNLNLGAIVREPYYTQMLNDFRGNGVEYNYPNSMQMIYKDHFLQNYKTSNDFALLRYILASNDIKPWKNSAKFYIYHGMADVTVDYSQAKEFAIDQNKNGGKVLFIPMPFLNHIAGFVPYWIAASSKMNEN